MPSAKPKTYADRKAKGEKAAMLWFPPDTVKDLDELRELLGTSKTAAICNAIRVALRVHKKRREREADTEETETAAPPKPGRRRDDDPDDALDKRAGYVRRRAQPVHIEAPGGPPKEKTLEERIRERGSNRSAVVMRTGEEVSAKKRAKREWQPRYISK